jgi:hypothetical protein
MALAGDLWRAGITMAFVAAALAGPPIANASIVLIDQTTRNGGFETAQTSPWQGFVEVANFAPASSGDYFGDVHGSPRSLAPVYQEFTPDPANGLSFLYRFDALSFQNSFTQVNVGVFARDDHIADIFEATVTPTAQPDLSTSWQTYEGIVTFDHAWDAGGQFRFSIYFDHPGASDSTNLRGGLDSVNFTQVPEPGSMVLLAGGGLLCLALDRRRGRQKGRRATGDMIQIHDSAAAAATKG